MKTGPTLVLALVLHRVVGVVPGLGPCYAMRVIQQPPGNSGSRYEIIGVLTDERDAVEAFVEVHGE